jgi:hypothetical protein
MTNNPDLDCLKCINFKKLHPSSGEPRPQSKKTCETAAMKGHLKCLFFAYNNGGPLSVKVMKSAAKYGHLDIVKYLYANLCPTDESGDECAAAAKNGNYEILKFLHEKGYVWNFKVHVKAVKNSHFKCLEYAFNKKCPKNSSDIFWEAAKKGNMEVLKFLYENRYPIDAYVINGAIQKKSEKVIKFLHETVGVPWNDTVFYDLDEYGYDDEDEIVQYIEAHGCTYDEITPCTICKPPVIKPRFL